MRSPVLGAVVLEPQHAAAHRLPTSALAVSLDGGLRVGAQGSFTEAPAFAISAHTPHTGAASGRHAIVLIDDVSPLGRAFRAAHERIDGGSSWLGELRRAVAARGAALDEPGVLTDLVADVLNWARSREGWATPPLDGRVGVALEVIERAAKHGEPVPSPVVPGVSAPHLRALFLRDVGRTISQHARYRRMLVAMAHIGGGASATRAAIHAGFSDSAHLSRTARESFGLTLRTIRGGTLLRSPAAVSEYDGPADSGLGVAGNPRAMHVSDADPRLALGPSAGTTMTRD